MRNIPCICIVHEFSGSVRGPMFSGSVAQCSVVGRCTALYSVMAPPNKTGVQCTLAQYIHWCRVFTQYTGAVRRRSVGGGFPQGADVSLAKPALNIIRESNRKEILCLG